MKTTIRRKHSRIASVAVLSFALVLVAVPAVRAQSMEAAPACKRLSADLKAKAQGMFEKLHPYDGCDETFAKCLARKSPHPVVVRLAADVCRKVKAGKSKAEIERALTRRARSALPMGKPATFALDEAMAAGPADAPITVVVYACARCPFCKVFVPAFYREVTDGALAGKVRLYFRPFPLKDHAGAMEGGLAMLSAARHGAFWKYLTKVYENYDTFCPKLLPDWAAAVGIDRAAFEQTYSDPTTRKLLVASKQEGLRNKVAATPTVFVNGRKYVYELNTDAVVDVVLEMLERGAK